MPRIKRTSKLGMYITIKVKFQRHNGVYVGTIKQKFYIPNVTKRNPVGGIPPPINRTIAICTDCFCERHSLWSPETEPKPSTSTV